MTENERLTIDEIIQHCNITCENTEMLAIARGQNQDDITSKGYWEHYQVANYLEELKQYRAIGTVKEIQQKLKNMSLVIDTDRDLLNRYIAIGTIEEFKALKEKGEPKKVIGIESGLQSLHCPSCSDWSGFEIKKGMKFCPNCGQALET